MFMKYTLMHMYKCVIVQTIKSKESHNIYFPKNAKNMNNSGLETVFKTNFRNRLNRFKLKTVIKNEIEKIGYRY